MRSRPFNIIWRRPTVPSVKLTPELKWSSLRISVIGDTTLTSGPLFLNMLSWSLILKHQTSHHIFITLNVLAPKSKESSLWSLCLSEMEERICRPHLEKPSKWISPVALLWMVFTCSPWIDTACVCVCVCVCVFMSRKQVQQQWLRSLRLVKQSICSLWFYTKKYKILWLIIQVLLCDPEMISGADNGGLNGRMSL